MLLALTRCLPLFGVHVARFLKMALLPQGLRRELVLRRLAGQA